MNEGELDENQVHQYVFHVGIYIEKQNACSQQRHAMYHP